MSGRVRRVVAASVILAGVGLAAAVLYAGDAVYEPAPSTERLLYLTSGKTARRLMVTFDAVAADVYWIRTIQHYGRDRASTRTTGRFELLEPLLDLTTTLDPHFTIAYRFGAIFLALPPPNGAGQVDRAIALLEKGLALDPNRWQYALDIGFVHYWHTGDYSAAGQWFARAAAMARAPIWLRPLAATTLARGGDREGARELLRNLEASEEAWIRQVAEKGLQQIQALDEIDRLQAAVERFYGTHQTYPTGWRDLQPPGARLRIPVDPSGVPYEYDPATHRVDLSPRSSLGPLPSLQTRK